MKYETNGELAYESFIVQYHSYQIAFGQFPRAICIRFIELVISGFLAGGKINYWHTFPLTAKKARVLETIIAELEDNPAPGGTVPVTSKSTGTGRFVFSFKGEK